LFERHDLQAVAPLACGVEAKLPHCYSAVEATMVRRIELLIADLSDVPFCWDDG
jgi:hypothetical protein